jgi:hypothetical protein
MPEVEPNTPAAGILAALAAAVTCIAVRWTACEAGELPAGSGGFAVLVVIGAAGIESVHSAVSRRRRLRRIWLVVPVLAGAVYGAALAFIDADWH